MENKENKELKEASERVKEFSMSKEERELYLSRLVAESCYYDDLHLAEERGTEKGKKERNIEIAKKMLKDKVDIEIIVKYTRFNKRGN